jgi:integrase
MGAESTVENYVKAVRKFVSYLGESDPEVALAKMKSGGLDAAQKADKFIDAMLKKEGEPAGPVLHKYTHGTVRNFMMGIKKWYALNGVVVNWKEIELPTSAERSEVDRAPSKEELKLLLNHAGGARDRAIILIASSSGLRMGTLLSLTVGDVNLNYPDVARLMVQRKAGRKFANKNRGSQRRFYCTFITPEAKQALIQYWKEREQQGEKLTAASPLISDAWNKGRFITLLAFERVWYRILKRAGLNEKSTVWYQLHVHTLRKYFRSNCVGIDASYREFWMGHKGGYLDESYFRAEEPQHLAQYRRIIPYLTVYGNAAEEKQLRSKMLLDFARLQGYDDEKLKRLEETLARAKTVDDAITEFRRFAQEPKEAQNHAPHSYRIAKSESELVDKLQNGWRLVQPLNGDKFLLEET